MNVASLQFLAFALGAALLLRLASLSQWSSIVFLCLNLSFLASFSTNPRQWLPMGCFLLAGYAAVRLLQRRQRWSLFLLLISVTLAAFVWLKKYSFLPNSLFITTPYMTIGLSYMFFRLAHL